MNREEYTNDDRRKGVQVAGPGTERPGITAGARPEVAGPGVERPGIAAGARPGAAGPGITDSAMIHIPLEDDIDRQTLFGSMDANLQLIREATGVDIIQRDDGLTLKGPARHMQDARKILEELETMIRKGEKIDSQKLHYVIALESEGVSYGEHNVSGDTIAFTCQGRPIKPKTIGQKRYVNSIRKRDVVFAIGPAGTGKTYLAVAMAVRAMKNKEVQKIILARPAVEAGENLGFLPGDLQDKVDPYLRPLYDALYDMLGREKALALKEKEIIEVVPLAYMRGRTLDDAFIILDEAQNTTREQMKMFLTRMGFGSKIVVTGDVTQIDLPKGRRSGLVEAEKILKDVKGIDFCYLKGVDVVRHEMVKRIISAYDEYYKNHPDSRSDSGARRRNGQK